MAGGSGQDFGFGGSYSLVRSTHESRATIENTVTLTPAVGLTPQALTVEALADHATTSIAANGASNTQKDGEPATGFDGYRSWRSYGANQQ